MRYKLLISLLSMIVLTPGCSTMAPASHRCNVQQSIMFTTIADTVSPTTQPTTETKPSTTQPRYTAPRAQFQGINFIAAAISASALSRSNTGKEASEASATNSGITGAPGLATPQARTVEAIVGQPGLQRGFPIGFGLLPSQNIFTRTFNPITGPNSACSALTSASFFSNITACQTQIKR